MKKITGPIKWHGGKTYLATRIIDLMPPRCKNPNAPAPDDTGWLHYVEPYFGGGAVLLAQEPKGISEVVNDMHGDLTNFWMTIQGQSAFNQFVRLVQSIPFSQHEFGRSAKNGVLEADGYGHSVHQAAVFFVRCRQSLAGRMKNFAPLTRNRTRRGMNEQASAWLGAIEGLPAVHERLKRVVILNNDALNVIRQQDGPRTLFYCDPPYLHSTRATTGEYEHEMSYEQHSRLLGTLADVKGRFMLSGYHSGMYDRQAAEHGWRCHEFEIDNKAAGGKTKRKMVECVWTNY